MIITTKDIEALRIDGVMYFKYKSITTLYRARNEINEYLELTKDNFRVFVDDKNSCIRATRGVKSMASKQVMMLVEELAVRGKIVLNCKRRNLLRLATEINKYLEENDFDWRVKYDNKEISLEVVECD